MNIAAIYRAVRFSPNSQEKDRLIMDAVVEGLRRCGDIVACMDEDDCLIPDDADLCITMARSERACNTIKKAEIPAVNCADSALMCSKQNVRSVMRSSNIPMSPDKGTCGYWVKRGDGQPQGSADVMFARTEDEAERIKKMFEARGITQVTIEAHVPGDLIKFYAVEGTGFFRTYYPTDDGMFKFDNEFRNGRAEHYGFDRACLEKEALRLARLLHTPVCGGDCIVRRDGTFALIDFNDWPSFSRCRTEAAEAIAQLINKKYRNR